MANVRTLKSGRLKGANKKRTAKADTNHKAPIQKPEITLANAPVFIAEYLRALAVNTCDIAKSLQTVTKELEKKNG